MKNSFFSENRRVFVIGSPNRMESLGPPEEPGKEPKSKDLEIEKATLDKFLRSYLNKKPINSTEENLQRFAKEDLKRIKAAFEPSNDVNDAFGAYIRFLDRPVESRDDFWKSVSKAQLDIAEALEVEISKYESGSDARELIQEMLNLYVDLSEEDYPR